MSIFKQNSVFSCRVEDCTADFILVNEIFRVVCLHGWHVVKAGITTPLWSTRLGYDARTERNRDTMGWIWVSCL